MKKIVILLFLAVGFWGCSEIVQLTDISNETVILLAPTNGASLNITTLGFNWEPIEDAENYQIQIATPNFENALQIVVDSTLTGNNFTATLGYRTYEWRVKAKNSGYQTNYTKQNFTIEE